MNPLLLLAQGLLTAGCVVACAYVVYVAWQSSGRKLAVQFAHLDTRQARLEHAWTIAKAEMEDLHGVVEQSLESVEKKRRQAAASAARAKPNGGQEQLDMRDPSNIRRSFEERGI